MRLTSFSAPSMNEAMALVRAALGDDAIIVTTRKEQEGVRITAAVEAPPLNAAADADEAPASAPEEILPAVRQALARHGVDGLMGDSVLAGVHDAIRPDQPVSPAVALAAALDACLRFAPVLDRADRPLLLVGAPGVGKTVTAAKLAAQARLAGKTVRIITTDTVKCGGLHQLAGLTEALRLGLRTAEDAAELAAAVRAADDGDLVVIDSCGANPFDRGDLGQLAALIDAAGAEPVLVMAAGADIVDATEAAEAFAALGCRRSIVTRLDIARRIGSVLHAADMAALALAEASTAPTIGSGLSALGPVVMARLLLRSDDRAAGAEQMGTEG